MSKTGIGYFTKKSCGKKENCIFEAIPEDQFKVFEAL